MVKNNQNDAIRTNIKGIPQFDNSCYLGGVPEDKMPEMYVHEVSYCSISKLTLASLELHEWKRGTGAGLKGASGVAQALLTFVCCPLELLSCQ